RRQAYRLARGRSTCVLRGGGDASPLLTRRPQRRVQAPVPPPHLPRAQRRLDLDRHRHLALADAPVLEVDGDFERAVAELLRHVGHLSLEDVAVRADAVEAQAT